MIEQFNFINNYYQLGQVEPVMINKEEKQEESSKYQEQQNIQDQQELYQKDKSPPKRGLRDSIMKQQMMGSMRGSLCKNNSMLQELKNIQQEKKSNQVNERELSQNINSSENQREQDQQNDNQKLSPQQQETALYLDKYYVSGNLNSPLSRKNYLNQINQIDNPELSSQTNSDINKSLSTLNQQSQWESNNSYVPKLDLNQENISNYTFKDSSSNNANQINTNFDGKSTEAFSSSVNETSPTFINLKGLATQNKKRNFIHKQILGVLEQEGYIVEVDNQTKLQEQLEILQAQKEIIRQASMDFETSRDSSPLNSNDLSLDVQCSNSSKDKQRKRHKNSSPNAHTPENFSPYKINSSKQNKDIFKAFCDRDQQLSGSKQILKTNSERCIPTPAIMKDIILDDNQAIPDRRLSCNEDPKASKRSLLRQNVFHTNIISKTPNSSTSNGGTTSWNDVGVKQEEVQQQESSKEEKNKSKSNLNCEIHKQNMFQLDNFLKQQKKQNLEPNQIKLEKVEKERSSSSSSLSDKEEERITSQKSIETAKASCGGESTRNRSMRMNIGWNTINFAKNQNSSDGDDEEDNKSGNNTNKSSSLKLANQFKQLTKYGTMESDQDSDSGRKKVDKLHINLSEKHEDGENDDQDKYYSQSVGCSGSNSDEGEYYGGGSMTSKSGQYISKFQKYYNNQNNNLQIDSIEEMESSQESIQKSSTKNSYKSKYPHTTKAIPKLDNPSNFLQYIHMRKSKRQNSKIDQQNNSENVQSNMSSSQNYSPDITFSGVFKFNEAMSDLNIDYSQSVKTSLCKSPISPSKQLSLSQSNFHFNLNQVKIDETSMSQQIKRVDSESDSSKSNSYQQTPQSNNTQQDSFRSEVPSMFKLPNSQSLISSYLANVNKDIDNPNNNNNNPTNSLINNNATIICKQDQISNIIQENNNSSGIVEQKNSNQLKQSNESSQFPNLFQQIKLQQIQDFNPKIQQQKEQLQNSDQKNYIKDYLTISPKAQIDSPQSPQINTYDIDLNKKAQDYGKEGFLNTPQNTLKDQDKQHQSSSSYISDFIKNLSSQNNNILQNKQSESEQNKQKTNFSVRYDILNNNQQKQQYSNISDHLTSLLQPTFSSQKEIQISETPRDKSKTMNFYGQSNTQNYGQTFAGSPSPINSLGSQQINFSSLSQTDTFLLNYNQKNLDISQQNSIQNSLPISKYGEKPYSTLNTLNQQILSNNSSLNDKNLFSQYLTDLDSQNTFSKQFQVNNLSQQTSTTENKLPSQVNTLNIDYSQNKYASLINTSTPLKNDPNDIQSNKIQENTPSYLLTNNSQVTNLQKPHSPSALNASNPQLFSASTNSINTYGAYSLNTLTPYAINTSIPQDKNYNIYSRSATPLLKENDIPLKNASAAHLLSSVSSQKSLQNLNDHYESSILIGTSYNPQHTISSKADLHSPQSPLQIPNQRNLLNQKEKNKDDLYSHPDLVKEDSMGQTPMVNSILYAYRNASSSTQINSNSESQSLSNQYQYALNVNEHPHSYPQININNQDNNRTLQNLQQEIKNTITDQANNLSNSNTNNYFDYKLLQNLQESTPLSPSQNNYYQNLQHQTSLNQNVSPSNSSQYNYDNLSQDFFPNNKLSQNEIQSHSNTVNIQNNIAFLNTDNNFSSKLVANQEDNQNKNNSSSINDFNNVSSTNSGYQRQLFGVSITTQISHTMTPYSSIQIQTNFQTSVQSNQEHPAINDKNNNQSIVEQILLEYRSKMQNQSTEAKSLKNFPYEKNGDLSPVIDHQRNLTCSNPFANSKNFEKNNIQDQNKLQLSDKNFSYLNSYDVNNNSHINNYSQIVSSLDSVNKIYSALPSQVDFSNLENVNHDQNININEQNLTKINQNIIYSNDLPKVQN